MSRSSDTRRLYAWEAAVLDNIPHLKAERSYEYIRRLIRRVCMDENYSWQDPVLFFDRGTRHNGRDISYCNDATIHLVRGQRNVSTVLHEITHAFGYGLHDYRFRQVYFRLLKTYGGVDAWTLWKITSKFCW